MTTGDDGIDGGEHDGLAVGTHEQVGAHTAAVVLLLLPIRGSERQVIRVLRVDLTLGHLLSHLVHVEFSLHLPSLHQHLL